MSTHHRLLRLALPWALGLLLSACQTTPDPVRPSPTEREAGWTAASQELAAAAARAAEAATAVKPRIDPVAEREKALALAMETYADGRYESAIVELTALIGAPELTLAAQVGIHKTVAFSHCALQQIKQCRQSFEAALQLDPTFQLTEAERGHPVWGREFRTVRAALPRKRPAAR
ncbi:TssQ family T6SS-associated lipoprotein [Pseudorhodoferax sp.]|uniref:TssQ family T6SS-associated lipoprotein n=1 Tax=Pseudorhodoferax sp. TaxID=1993553 RepID=UPI002DD6A597|nr:TssQ family T6SS-associated lipoprotein [Pseudorhodoferax sp.]